MIISEISDFDYRVSFHHDGVEVSPRSTTCKIECVSKGDHFKTEGKLVSIGKATCASVDNFNKSYGRFVSLKRALKGLSLSKEDRREFWVGAP